MWEEQGLSPRTGHATAVEDVASVDVARRAAVGMCRCGRGHGIAVEGVASVAAASGRGRTDRCRRGCRCVQGRPGGKGVGAGPAAADEATGWPRRTSPLRMWLRGGGRGSGGPPPWTRPQDDHGCACVDMAARDCRMGYRRGRERGSGRNNFEGCRCRRGRVGPEGKSGADAADEVTEWQRMSPP